MVEADLRDEPLEARSSVRTGPGLAEVVVDHHHSLGGPPEILRSTRQAVREPRRLLVIGHLLGRRRPDVHQRQPIPLPGLDLLRASVHGRASIAAGASTRSPFSVAVIAPLPARAGRRHELALHQLAQQPHQTAAIRLRHRLPARRRRPGRRRGGGERQASVGFPMATHLPRTATPRLPAASPRHPAGSAAPGARCSAPGHARSRPLWVQYSWLIEVAFHDHKQVLGFEDPQNQTPEAVARTAPMAGIIYDLVLLWYAARLQQGHATGWLVRPWYRSKTTPSFLDMLTAVRQDSWRLYFSDPPSPTPVVDKPPASWPDSLLSTA